MLLRTLLLALLLPASALADAGGAAPECSDDALLARAAGELLLRHSAPPPPEALASAVRDAGSDLVGVHAFFSRGAADDRSAWLARIASQADAPLVCGSAQSDGAELLLVSARAGTLSALTARSTSIRGSLRAGFRDPELVIADGNDELQRVRVDGAALARGVAIDPELPRPLHVQLLARGIAGPRPIAERVLPAAGAAARATNDEPERAVAATTGTNANASTSEDEPAALAAMLTTLRQREGRSALRDNQLLARVASAQAGRICAEGRVAHELTPGDDPQRRLRGAGIEARRVGETVARARDASAAFAAFERSPSHRLTLLEPDFTDAGIGAVKDDQGRSCVVVVLAAWPRFVGR